MFRPQSHEPLRQKHNASHREAFLGRLLKALAEPCGQGTRLPDRVALVFHAIDQKAFSIVLRGRGASPWLTMGFCLDGEDPARRDNNVVEVETLGDDTIGVALCLPHPCLSFESLREALCAE
jgi:hypothetical protein